jgi:hypothetical protein
MFGFIEDQQIKNLQKGILTPWRLHMGIFWKLLLITSPRRLEVGLSHFNED